MKFAATESVLAVSTCLLSCSHHVYGAALAPTPQLPGKDSFLQLAGNNTLSGISPFLEDDGRDDLWFHKVVIRPRPTTMSVQATANILIRTLPSLAREPPGDVRPWLITTRGTVDEGNRPGYYVTLDVRSTNRPAPFQLTNRRLLYALTNLGLFDQMGEQTWHEFDFDIRLSNASAFPTLTDTTIIGMGNFTQKPLTSTG